jgi:HD-GYP domain-containing protein (c-di-GMP phosphodiesterase class II)
VQRPIDPRTLTPGEVLRETLYSRHGARLVVAGTRLTRELCRSLRGLPGGSVVVQTAGGPSAPVAVAAPAGGARPGVRRVRLLAAEELVSQRAGVWSRLPLRVERVRPPMLDRDDDYPGWPSDAELARCHGRWVSWTGSLIRRIVAGEAVRAAEAGAIVEEALGKLRRHPGRFGALTLLETDREDEYPAGHCFAVCCLSLLIAARRGWGERDVRAAGLAGLLADVGMAAAPAAILAADRPLDDAETSRLLRHPAHSATLLDGVEGLPERVKRAAYQHQERENGRGYPARARGGAISDLARVVAVADSFAAATRPRPYRARRRPYDALVELVALGAQGWLDRASVHALTRGIGIYPVGSWVRLSDGSVARVRRVRRDAIDRPVVERAGGDEADLGAPRSDGLRVVGAADPPGGRPAAARDRAGMIRP